MKPICSIQRWTWVILIFLFAVSTGEAVTQRTSEAYHQLFPNELEQLTSAVTPQQPHTTFGKGLFGFPAFSPDNEWLAVPTPCGIELHDTQDWQQVAFLPTAGPGISARFSPDSQRLVCQLRDNGDIEVWDIPTRTRLATLEGGRSDVWTPPDFFSDGRYLLQSVRGTIHMWDMTDYQPLEPMQTARMWGEYYSFEPKQGIAALVNQNRRIVELWDINTRELRLCLPVDRGNILRLEFSPDGKTLAVLRTFRAQYRCESSEENRGSLINFWDTVSWRKLNTLHGDYHTFSGNIAFHPDSNRLAVAGWDGAVRLWDVRKGKQGRVLQEPPEKGSGGWAIFQPSGKHLATVSIEAGVGLGLRIWDVRRRRLVHELSGYNYDTKTIRLSPNTRLLATGNHSRIQVWDVHAGTRTSLPGLLGSAFEFSPDGSQLICHDEEGVRLVRMPSGETLRQFQLPGESWIRQFQFTTDGKLYGWLTERTTEDNMWEASVWDVFAQESILSLGTFEYMRGPMRFSNDGKFVAHADEETGIGNVWRIPEGNVPIRLEPLRELDSHHSMRLAFSPTRPHLAVWRGRQGIDVYDLEAADPVVPIYALDMRTWPARWFGFSPDGRAILCSLPRYDGLLLWDLEGHRVAFMALPRAYDVNDASFSADGQFLATAGESGVAALWREPIRLLREQGIALQRGSKLARSPSYLHRRLFSGTDGLDMEPTSEPERRQLIPHKPGLRYEPEPHTTPRPIP